MAKPLLHKRTADLFTACGKINVQSARNGRRIANTDAEVTCKACLKRMAFAAALRR